MEHNATSRRVDERLPDKKIICLRGKYTGQPVMLKLKVRGEIQMNGRNCLQEVFVE